MGIVEGIPEVYGIDVKWRKTEGKLDEVQEFYVNNLSLLKMKIIFTLPKL